MGSSIDGALAASTGETTDLDGSSGGGSGGSSNGDEAEGGNARAEASTNEDEAYPEATAGPNADKQATADKVLAKWQKEMRKNKDKGVKFEGKEASLFMEADDGMAEGKGGGRGGGKGGKGLDGLAGKGAARGKGAKGAPKPEMDWQDWLRLADATNYTGARHIQKTHAAFASCLASR